MTIDAREEAWHYTIECKMAQCLFGHDLKYIKKIV